MLRFAQVFCLATCCTLVAACAAGNEAPPPFHGAPDASGSDSEPPDASQEGVPEAAPETGTDAEASVGPDADAASDVANPCEGKACNTPPGNICENATDLKVYDAQGTCDNGVCNYGSHLAPCQFGCNVSACEGDPCIGVTCNSPPASACSDTTHLTVYETPGSCSNGTCSYTSHEELCNFGCQSNICNGNPCTGVTCNTPSASFCTDGTHLQVYETPGTCTNGSCSYGSHEEYCTFGCVLGKCEGDPCQGVTCNTPPAKYCAGPNTIRSYSSSGTCAGGSCSYTFTDANCPFGCLNGVCKDCTVQGDCDAGKWCNNGTCTTCNTSQHCGSSCTDCTALNPVQSCNGSGTACIQCTSNTDCGSGKWCNNNVCETCNTAAHCGASCVACSGTTPDCNGTSCYCAGSCGPACPVAKSIGTWDSGADGWSWDDLWRRENSMMVAGSSNNHSTTYTETLILPVDTDLSGCTAATLSFLVRLADDASYYQSTVDKSERLYVACSGDGGGTWTNMTPTSWPANQSACGDSYCCGANGSSRAFPLTSQTMNLPAACVGKAYVRFRFQAKGGNAWRLQNPGWYVDSVVVN